VSRATIVIPACNQGRYLWQTASTAAVQSHDDVEVVVVDDGSTDDTAAVCSALAGIPRVRIIRQDSLGFGTACNRGVYESSGDYLCFLDAGGYYHSDKVVRQVKQFERNPQLGFVYCDVISVDGKGLPLVEQLSVGESRKVVNGDILESLVLGQYFPPLSVMMRRAAFETLRGFDESLEGHWDLDLWLRLAARGYGAEYLDEKLAYHRSHCCSIRASTTEPESARIAALTKITRLFPERVARSLFRLHQMHEQLQRRSQVA